MAACISALNKGSSANVETQKSEIEELMKKKLVKGDTWYLIDARWWKTWKKFVGYELDQFSVEEELNDPGPIDNSNLFANDGWTLKKHLIYERDFNCLPEEAWFKLVSWYGLTSDHQTIPRKVAEYGMHVKSLKIEVYLTELRLGWKTSDPQTLVTRQFSKGDTIGKPDIYRLRKVMPGNSVDRVQLNNRVKGKRSDRHIMSEMRKIFSISSDLETRVWTKYRSNKYELHSDMGFNVRDVGLYDQQILLIEQKNEDGTWGKPRSPHSSSLTSVQSGDVEKLPSPIQKNPKGKLKIKISPRRKKPPCSETKDETRVSEAPIANRVANQQECPLNNAHGKNVQVSEAVSKTSASHVLSVKSAQLPSAKQDSKELEQDSNVNIRWREVQCDGIQMRQALNEEERVLNNRKKELCEKEKVLVNMLQDTVCEEQQARTRVKEVLNQARITCKKLEERLQHELVETRQALDDEIRLCDTGERQLKEKETIVDQLRNTLSEEQQMRTLLEERLQTEMLSSQVRQQELQRLLEEERQQKTILEERLRNLELQMQEERNRNLSSKRELQSAVSAAQQELQRKENASREQQRLLEEERQQKTALEERLRNLELQMQEEGNRNLQLQSAVSAAQQELQRKENASREQQRLLEEERQQRTALEERLRNLELQMQEERKRNLSNERELQSAVSAAQARVAEYQLHPSHDWIIQREEVLLSDNVLGNGAWGSVRQGKFRGCQVAVKEIHELILSPHNRRLFEREMSIASCCRHPNLLQFIGATNDDGSPLFVTEILDTSLRRLLSQQALNHEEIVSLAFDIAKGLNYLHLHRPLPIIHRDISSANVLLWRRDEGWRAKLSDYGSANFMRQCMTVNPGAILYSAPEALTSQQSPKVDVYSFGLLLCEMCVRELPVPQEVRCQIGQVTNGALRGLIEQCVKRDPEERPTMNDIIYELEQLAQTKRM